jgi:nitrite reductase (NADH) small subunit
MTTTTTFKWYLIGKASEFPLNEGKRIRLKDLDVALFNLGDSFKAIDNTCPHKQGPLADGIVAGNAVFCPLHNLKMNLDTGCAFQEGEGKVQAYPVQVANGNVYIAFDD